VSVSFSGMTLQHGVVIVDIIIIIIIIISPLQMVRLMDTVPANFNIGHSVCVRIHICVVF
jgi:hypothetical protein